jgi:hypothetical protein
MVPGTRALQLVSSYPQREDNYPLVIAALPDLFGDKVLLTEVYVRQLLKLVIKTVGKPINGILSAMYDELESHLRALKTLGALLFQLWFFSYSFSYSYVFPVKLQLQLFFSVTVSVTVMVFQLQL